MLRRPLHHIGREHPVEGPPASPLARRGAVRSTELVCVWSAERCKRLDFAGLSGTPKIDIKAANSRSEQWKRAVKGGREGRAKGLLRKPLLYPLSYEG